MATFKLLNKQLFLQKRRYANLVLVIQAFAIAFLTVLIFLNHQGKDPFWTIFVSSNVVGRDYFLVPATLAILTTMIGDLVFGGLMAWQNEKVNNSQTFQLIPFSTNQTWLTNLFSSLLTCAYVFIIQVVVCWFLMVPVGLYEKKNIWAETVRGIGWWTNDFWDSLQVLEYITVVATLFFVAVTFVNYASKIISEQLPLSNTRWLRILLIALITFVGLYFAMEINDHLYGLYIHNVVFKTKHGGGIIYDNPMWLYNIEAIAAVIIIGGLDLFLGHKYWEPRRDH